MSEIFYRRCGPECNFVAKSHDATNRPDGDYQGLCLGNVDERAYAYGDIFQDA